MWNFNRYSFKMCSFFQLRTPMLASMTSFFRFARSSVISSLAALNHLSEPMPVWLGDPFALLRMSSVLVQHLNDWH